MKKVNHEKIKLLLLLLVIEVLLVTTLIISNVHKNNNENEVVETSNIVLNESIDTSYINIQEEDTYTDYEDLGKFKITYYCHCVKCCGKDDRITYSGTIAEEGRTIAADTSILPIGTKVIIDNHVYVVEDIGGAIKGNKIDVYVSSHEKALQNGVKYENVYLEI